MQCQNPDCKKDVSDGFGSYGNSGRKPKYCDSRCRSAAYRRRHGTQRKITRRITVNADELLDIVLVASAYDNEIARRELMALMHRHGLGDYLNTVDWETRKEAAKEKARRTFRRLHGLG